MNTSLPLPDNEKERLKALESYSILDTEAEREFDRLTELASLICNVPISLISLIDKDRQWFKSKTGLDVPETHRDISFCQYAIKEENVFEITDATKDGRFKNNPLVTGEPNIRFYAGYPLIDPNGFALGTLCVIDREPRILSAEQQKALALLGKEVVSQILARRERKDLYEYAELFKTSVDMVCVAGADGFFKRVNPAFTAVLGWTERELLDKPFLEFVHPDDLESTKNEIVKLGQGIKTLNFTNRYRKKDGTYLILQWVANPDQVTGNLYSIARDVTETKKIEAELQDYAELFKTTTDMVCLSASDGYFKKVNQAFTQVLGWSEEELLKEPYAKLIHPDDIPRTINEIKKLREGIKSYSFINRLRTKSGGYRTVQWSSNPSKISGFTYAIARDITDIKKNEAALQDSFYEITQLQKALDEAAIVTRNDKDYRVTYVNDKFCEVSGYTREELLGANQIQLSSNYHTKEFLNGILEIITKGNIWKGQVKSMKKNGEMYWVDTTIVPLVKNGGKPHEYITIRYDITAQKNIEEQIRHLAEMQGAILNGTDYSIIATGVDGTITNFNKGAEEMLGYTAEEVINELTPIIIHDAEELVKRAKVLSEELKMQVAVGFEVFAAKSRLGMPDVNEWTYIKKDGSRITVILSITALYDSKKNITGYLGIARDVTATKKQELLLKRSEEKHRLFFENAQGLMCTHDRNGKFLSMNHAGAALIGYSREELINRSLFDVTPANVEFNVKQYLDKIFTSGSDEGLMRVLHKNGTIKVWLYKNVLVKDTTGEDIAIGNAIDISDRIKAEKQLQKAKLLAEKSVLAKDQFLANMSHEIRTPMNAIIGFSDVLKATPLDNKQKEYLDAISNSGENLLVIINDILDFSKIESGHLNLENKPLSIRETLNHVKNLLAFKAKERNIALNVYIENDIPEFVLADGVRLNQIFINLVGNAVKFTERGKIEVFCNVHSLKNNTAELKIVVRDTGIGIPPDKLSLIFERFKQAEDNTTRKFGGTGLGLSITKSLVELYRGTITVKSELGQGSEFSVLIPFTLAEKPTESAVKEEKIKPQEKTLSVLITEDNELNQKLAKHILETNKIQCEIAENGEVAVEILKTKTFDVILMDLQMPLMDGYVATSFIRNILKLKTPIIAMTAHSLLGEKERCMQGGMNYYLSKPYKAAELIETIHLLVENARVSGIGSGAFQPTHNSSYDLSNIEELSNNDPEFVKDMIAILLREIPLELEKLNSFRNQANFAEVKRVAHKMKSSYSLFKMDTLAELAHTIEMGQNLDEVSDKIHLLIANTETALQDLRDTETK